MRVTVKNLREAFPDLPRPAAERIVELHREEFPETAIRVFNNVLNLHGVEEIVASTRDVLTYANTGDPYRPTLYHWRGVLRIGAWGDLVERHPKLFP